MSGSDWMEVHIKENWHKPEFRKGLAENKKEMERELGRKLPDLPVVAKLKAKGRELEYQKKASAKTSLGTEMRA